MTELASIDSADKACEFSAMTEYNIPRTNEKSLYCIYCPDTLNTYQREPKLFKFHKKATFFLDNELYQKIAVRQQGHKNAALAVQTVS